MTDGCLKSDDLTIAGGVPSHKEQGIHPVHDITLVDDSDIRNKLSQVAPSRWPIWSLSIDNQTRRLLKPVTFYVSETQEGFLAENDTFDVFGEGENRQQAIEIAKERLEHHYKHYIEIDDDKLTESAKKIKKLFSNLAS